MMQPTNVVPEQVQMPEPFDFDRLMMGDPTQARPTDPATSHEAALRSPDSKKVAAAILDALHWGPMTDEQISRYLKVYTPERVRTVRAQLVRAGKVRESGLYGMTSRGRRATEWMATA